MLHPTNIISNLTNGIQWSSAPDIRTYQNVSAWNQNVNFLLSDSATGDVLFYQMNLGLGNIVGFTPIYSSNANQDFLLWLYSPYFLYRILTNLSNYPTLDYPTWPYSPVPHITESTILIIIMVICVIGSVVGYVLAKKYSRTHPLKIHHDLPPPVEKKSKSSSLSNFLPSFDEKTGEKWKKVGLRRQINSLFLNLLVTLLINTPFMIFTIAIYSQYIQPFPMVNGWTGWFGGILSSIFVILDFGMGAACNKILCRISCTFPNKSIKIRPNLYLVVSPYYGWSSRYCVNI